MNPNHQDNEDVPEFNEPEGDGPGGQGQAEGSELKTSSIRKYIS